MGWAHPAVTMEEVLGLVRGFVDVLVLAGGRTSSGAAASGDPSRLYNVFSVPISYARHLQIFFCDK
jgi:hypothetical protein